jgi:uncharacterized protein YndB with AHSA1/START domain
MADAGISITRVFDAPRERVWREWTTPEAFADWYGGAAVRIPLSSVAMDVRVGGGWRATMVFDGQEIHWKGEYLEVDEPRRLVFTVTDRPEADARELVTVELVDLGEGRTEMHFEQRGGMTPEQYERAGKGWGGFFDRMAERLAAA